MRVLPRLAGDQILGDDARLGRLSEPRYASASCACASYIVGFETAVDADFDELQERRDLARHAGHEFLQQSPRRR